MKWFQRRDSADDEQRRELESYLEIATDENVARGMAPNEARAAARRKLGNYTQICEETYQMNSNVLFDTLRHAAQCLRLIQRNPLFSVFSLLTLAIGIGANTAVFAVLNAVLLKPLAYPQAGKLVSVQHTAPGAPGSDTTNQYGSDLNMALDGNGDPAFAWIYYNPSGNSDPSDSQLLFHPAVSKIQPRLIYESAKLVKPCHPDHHRSGVCHSSESLFAFAQRAFDECPPGDVVNRSDQMGANAAAVEEGRDGDFSGQPPLGVIGRFYPGDAGLPFYG